MINEYLADAFPPGGGHGASPLLPESPAGRAKARMIAQRSNDLVKAFFTYLSNSDQVGQQPANLWKLQEGKKVVAELYNADT